MIIPTSKKKAWITIGCWLLLIALLSPGLKKLAFNNDYKVFFSEDNPDLVAFEYIEDKYNGNDSVLVVVESPQGDVFDPNTLSAVIDLTDRGWQTPHSYRVDSLTNYQYTVADGDDLVVQDLFDESVLQQPDLLASRGRYALGQPELVNRVVSADGSVTAINVLVRLPDDGKTAAVREIADHWRGIVATAKEKYPDLKFYLTGQIMQNDAFGEATERDASTLVPLAFLLVVVGTGLYLRSFSAVAIVAVTIISAIVLALCTTGWLGISLTSVSASAPLIILTLAVADCIHLLNGYYRQKREGSSSKEAIERALLHHRWPIALTSVTTVVGFLSMNLSDSPPFRDLGNITAIGVVWAMLLTLSLAPALLTVLPHRRKVHADMSLAVWLGKLAKMVMRRPLPVAGILLVVGCAIAVNLQQNKIDDTLFEYFDESFSVRRANDFTYERLTGVASIQYAIRPAEGQLVSSPSFLASLSDAVAEIRRLEGVYHVQSLTDIMKRLNASLHGDDPEYYQLPIDEEQSAQTLLLYEMSLPYGLNLNNQVSLDKRELRLLITAHKMSSGSLLELEAAAREVFMKHFDAAQVSPGVSADVIFAHIGYRNNVSMLTASAIALFIICALIGVLLRSVRLGLISVLPNVLPAAIAFGFWGLTVGEVGLSLSVVACMTLGIVVDDTIHLLYSYHRARRGGASETDSVVHAMESAGTALIGTTVVLGAGFLVLGSSGFKMNADMGLMTAATLFIALILDLLLVPALLKLTAPRGGELATVAAS